MAEIQVAQGMIAAYWNRVSAAYDDAPDHRLRGAAEHAAWLDLLRGIVPQAPARILDLGTGTGFLALLLAELGHEVLGIDIAEGMVAIARQKAAGLPVPPRFMVGDAGAPPVDAASVDVVVNRHLLWTLPDPLGALHNWHRALRPGGLLVVIDGLWAVGEETGTADTPAESVDETYAAYYTPEVEGQLPLLGARSTDRVVTLIEEAGFGGLRDLSLAPLERAQHRLHPGNFILTARS
ncbi:MAG: class I SAM-dependent methyltransferase [Thermomicrobiales bacterium]